MDDPITARTKRLVEMIEFADTLAKNSPYSTLALRTGVRSSKWRDLMRGRTKAVTSEMLCGLAHAWPEYGLWLMCGSCDVSSVDVGQKAAELACTANGLLQVVQAVAA